MNRTRRIVSSGLVTLLAAGAVLLVPTIWGKPWSIDHFYARTFLMFAVRHPMMLSSMRILEPLGIDFHNNELDDVSIAFQQREAAWLDKQVQILHRYDRESLDEAGRLSYDILDWFLQDAQQANRFMFYDYPINQLGGSHTGLPDFMTTTHQINNLEEARDYVERLQEFGRFFDQIIEGIRYREELGILPPRWVYPKVLQEIDGFAQTAASENVLYTHLAERLREVGIDRQRQQAVLEDALQAIESIVVPAYVKLRDVMAEQETRATNDDGVWRLPRGEAFYAQQLRHHTTTDMTADEIHRLGLRRVAQRQSEMRALLAAQGYDEITGLGQAMQALSEEERFRYPDTDEGRRQILEDFRRIVAEADADLDAAFDLRPKSGVEVVRIPEFKQENSTGAYYESPPFDGSRPGRFFVNLRGVDEHTRFNMRTLAYHEAIPGHHYQIALAQEMQDVPFFRRIIPFTAYVEGWAHYSETVADEYGFHPDVFSRLGYLQAQMFRAVRLVVDTGIHSRRWTRQQAIDYMLDNTGMAEVDVVAEVERYIVNPGQACAYKVGQLTILGLRQRAIDELGEAFDIQEFHNVVLRDGAMPLRLLEEQVGAWITSTEGGRG